MNPSFYIHEYKEPFVVEILAWSRDAELISAFGIYDPRELQFIEFETSNSQVQHGAEYYRKKILDWAPEFKR